MPKHRDTAADSGINDQLIKLHNTHSWIRPSQLFYCVLFLA